MDLKTVGDYLPTQFKLIGHNSREKMCLLRGTNGIFRKKYTGSSYCLKG
jgi:hypothetical protein